MAFPDGTEGGVRSPFSGRVGIDIPRFRGVNRQNDPGSLGDEQFWLLQNCRIDGTGVKNRPGLSKVFTNAMDACVYGIWDDRNPNDNNGSANGNAIFPAIRIGYGPQIWDFGATPFQASPYGRICVPFNGVVIWIDDSGTGHLVAYTTVAVPGEVTFAPVFTSEDVFEYTSGLAGAAVMSGVAFDGSVWFIVWADDQTYNELWQWTGGATATLVLGEGDLGNTAYANLATDGVDLYYAAQGLILKRNDGAWDELVLPVGAGTNWTPTGWGGIHKPPYVYFAGFDADVTPASQTIIILQILDETVTVLNDTVPTWTGTRSSYGVIAEMGGALYIVGPLANGDDDFRLYEITGSGTPSVVADLTSQLGVGTDGAVGSGFVDLFTWRNQLYGSFPKPTTSGIFARCADGDPTTWELLEGDDATGQKAAGSPIFSA